MPIAVRFNVLSAGTFFNFCYCDFWAIQGHAGLWRKMIPGKVAPEGFFVIEATCDDGNFYFVRDDQAVDELINFTQWSSQNVPEQEEQAV